MSWVKGKNMVKVSCLKFPPKRKKHKKEKKDYCSKFLLKINLNLHKTEMKYFHESTPLSKADVNTVESVL